MVVPLNVSAFAAKATTYVYVRMYIDRNNVYFVSRVSLIVN